MTEYLTHERLAQWVTPCGRCEYGVTTAPCLCPDPDADPRPLMSAMLIEINRLRQATGEPEIVAAMRVEVILFKPSGKYYTSEKWQVPADAIGPHDMERSPDFRRIDGGAILIESQEPWGYPCLFPSE